MKKNKTDKSAPPNKTETEPPSPKIKKRSLAATLFRGSVYFVLFIFLLLAGVGIVLEYYFPAEEVRVFAEKEGTKQLKLPLSIKKIKFSLLSGVRIDGVTLGPTSKPLASVQTVVLGYDLSQLLQGNLVINQVLVDQPQLNAISKKGVWNFQPLLDLSGPNKTSPSGGSTPLPIAEINLQEFQIRNATAKLVMDDHLSAHIKGLSVEAKGKARSDAIDLQLRVFMKPDQTANILFDQQKEKLHFQSHTAVDLNFSAKDLNKLNVSGSFGLNKNQIILGDTLPSPDLKGSLSAELQIKPELINLSAFSLTLDNKNEIQLSTKIKNFSTHPQVELNIKKASFQLTDILKWGAKWIPPLSGKGTLEAKNLSVIAQLPNMKPESVVFNGGLLSTKNLDVKAPDFQIEKMDSSLKINEVSLKNGKPVKFSADLKVLLGKGQAKGIRIQNLKQSFNLIAQGSDLSQIKTSFKTEIESLHYNHPLSSQANLSLHTEGSLSGNWKQGDINIKNISFNSGEMLEGTVSGEIKQKKSFQLQQNLSLNIAEVLKILPKEFSGKIPEIQGLSKTQFSFSGTLNPNFLPTKVSGKSQITLERFSAKLEEPFLQVDDLNTKVEFPVTYLAEKGVKIPTLTINANLKNLDALKNWKLTDFSAESKFLTDSYYNLKPDFGTLPIKLDSHIKLGNLHSAQPELSVSDFSTKAHLKGDLQSNDFRNGHLNGEVSFKNIKALKKLRVGEVASQFSLQVHDKSLSRIRLSQKTKITSINEDDLKLNLKELDIESLTRKNLQSGNFDLDNFLFRATDLMALQLKGNAKNWGESFNLESTVDPLQLASVWKQLPANMKKDFGLTGVDGTAKFSIKVQGSLPPAKNPQSDKDLKPFMQWEKILASISPNSPPPIELAAQFQLKNGKANHFEKKIHSVNLDTQIKFKNNSAEAAGNATGKLLDNKFFEKLPLQPEFKFQYQLKNLDTLILAKHQLNLKNRGVRHTVQGELGGLKSFLKGPLNPERLLKNINISLKNENNLNITEAMKAEFLEDIKATGEMSSSFEINQAAGKNINLQGRIGFNQFTAETPTGMALKNLTGNFPFSKSFSLDKDVIPQESFSPSKKSFFKQLRDFSRYKNNIQVDSLEVAGQRIANIGMDMVFKDNRLTADKFMLDVLGGTVGGNFSFEQTEKGPTLKFVTEFAKIDSSRLLPKTQEQNIDSKIDGNMEMAIQVDAADVSLDELLLKIAITRIGTKTLDRLLLFIDPEESKPAIVDTRAKLKLAAPHRVLISIENGNLNLEAWLKSDLFGIIKAPELKRIPVAGLKQFEAINEQLQSLQATLKILNIIAANRILFENQEMVFKN